MKRSTRQKMAEETGYAEILLKTFMKKTVKE
jgi:hypothetical protein